MLLIVFGHDVCDLARCILSVDFMSDSHHRHKLLHKLALRADFQCFGSMSRFQEQLHFVLRLVSRHVLPELLVVKRLRHAYLLDIATLVGCHGVNWRSFRAEDNLPHAH